MAELSSARRKHRFIYCCVIAGRCFEVTVLAWCKYTTVIIPFTRKRNIKGLVEPILFNKML
jgi:hypothetical protein